MAAGIDVVKRSYEAFARDDMDGVLADMHPDIEWHQAQGLPHGGTYRGVAEVSRVVRRDPARVHRHHRAGLEGDDLAPGRVVQPHRHSMSMPVNRTAARVL